MSDTARFLGFAFANADFLFEIDKEGTILFATGATSEFVETNGETLVGVPVGRLFQPSEGSKFGTYVHALAQGDRAGPFRLKLRSGAEANVSMFRLPDNDNKISCTFAKPGARTSFASQSKDEKTGLSTRDSFLAVATKLASDDDALTLLDVPALPQLCQKLSPGKADKLLAAIGQSITTAGAKAAGRLSETSFGAVADAVRGPGDLAARLRAALAAGGLRSAMVKETLVSLKGRDLTPEQRVLAVRYVVERFATGQEMQGTSDVGEAFNTMMDETQERARNLTDMVADGAFSLAYQPIKNLQGGGLSHFEALARFNPGHTGETIELAEKLGIADAFDLAVALKVMATLDEDTAHMAHVAFNISGQTIQSPASFALLAGFLARKRKLAPRLLIEITETAEITDLEGAAKAVAVLRAMGYRVGLDDFGAGAATLNYLHAFSLDFVKFDGALVKKIGNSKRDDMLLSGMLKLCGELGVATVAECLETEEDVVRARKAGFTLGQGYALGEPAPRIPADISLDTGIKPGKRRGLSSVWS